MRHAVDRRTVLVAAGAGLLQACSDDDPDALAPGRRRRRRRRGKDDGAEPRRTRLTQDDLDEVAARLSALLDGDDRQAFLDYARPADAVQWERMWDGLHTVPALDRTFWLQRADGSWVNQRGGPVTATLRGVVSYRIDGCDAEPMAHLCDLSVFKPARGPARVQTLGPLRDETEAPWLLAPVACEVGSHAVLISRVEDAVTARGMLDQVDAGARRAMDVVTAPAGVSRICVTLGWPQVRDRLYGGSQGDFIGSAHGYRYVDPQQLADTGERGTGAGVEGSRVVIDPAATSAQGAEQVAAHESVHALAFQWGQSAPPLYAEGLARYVELGPEGTERAARDLGPDLFADFARRVTARPGRQAFYDPTYLEDNYTGAAATCAFVAREQGESALLDLVRAAYDASPDPTAEVLGTSQRDLLREVRRWLEDAE